MKNNRNWKWKRRIYMNGCNTVTLNSWQALPDFLLENGYQAPHYLFRGQSYSSYPLSSALHRALKNNPVQNLDKHLENFKYSIRGQIKKIHRYSDSDLWVLGQQNGLKTPLIEWTKSPYIALFFAFHSMHKISLNEEAGIKEFRRAKGKLSESRIIYALNQHTIEQYRKKFRLNFVRQNYPKLFALIKEMAGNLISINDPYYLDQYIDKILLAENFISDHAKLINACETATRNRDHFFLSVLHPKITNNINSVAQNSVYTFSPSELTIEEWVKENFSETQENVLLKITIPDTDRDKCLESLNQMNINYSTLFPNLQGAAHYCNSLLTASRPT